MHLAQYLRRKEAAKYLNKKYGLGSEKTLAKLACVGGGLEFYKAGPTVLYSPSTLDQWALSKIGEPQRSTSDSGQDKRCSVVGSEPDKRSGDLP